MLKGTTKPEVLQLGGEIVPINDTLTARENQGLSMDSWGGGLQLTWEQWGDGWPRGRAGSHPTHLQDARSSQLEAVGGMKHCRVVSGGGGGAAPHVVGVGLIYRALCCEMSLPPKLLH